MVSSSEPTHHFLTVSHAGQADLAAAHAFHQRRSGEYLWPRNFDDFATLVDDRHVFIAYEEKAIVGLCYVVDDGDRREFGGLYVEEHLRGRGIAAVLGRLAIASAFIWDYIAEDPWDLIAHVHELNSAPGESPRSLLTRHLGFEDIHEKEVPPVEPPPNMRRNERGEVVGDLFRFRREALSQFADWFDGFDGALHGKAMSDTYLTINHELWTDRGSLLPGLRELSEQRS